MKQTILRKYARLIARVGANIQKGQDVIIGCDLDQPKFVELLVDECYKAGARKVKVEFDYQPLEKLHVRHQSVTTMARVEEWEKARLQHYVDTLPCRIYLASEDPDGLKGINQEKMAKADQKRWPIVKPYWDTMENKYQWCIAGVPGVPWARKVFPGVPDAEAVEKLWRAILRAARAEGDPIANWEEHNATIHRRCERLNALHLAALEYNAPNGTSFRVGLMPEGIFAGGSETDLKGRVFNPNIPSEEIFTSPKRGVAEGLLVATKPLSWQGSLIEDFSIRFAGGRAVEVRAEKGREALEKMIAMDDGAPYLGECALIAHDSPISNMGILFYNTLYDENASCHVALGRGFDNCVADYAEYTQEELRALGVNDSMIHVDFMIGGAELDITGVTAEGEKIPVFRQGAWCF